MANFIDIKWVVDSLINVSALLINHRRTQGNRDILKTSSFFSTKLWELVCISNIFNMTASIFSMFGYIFIICMANFIDIKWVVDSLINVSALLINHRRTQGNRDILKTSSFFSTKLWELVCISNIFNMNASIFSMFGYIFIICMANFIDIKWVVDSLINVSALLINHRQTQGNRYILKTSSFFPQSFESSSVFQTFSIWLPQFLACLEQIRYCYHQLHQDILWIVCSWIIYMKQTIQKTMYSAVTYQRKSKLALENSFWQERERENKNKKNKKYASNEAGLDYIGQL